MVIWILHDVFKQYYILYLGNLFLDENKQKRVSVELFEDGQISPLTLARW